MITALKSRIYFSKMPSIHSQRTSYKPWIFRLPVSPSARNSLNLGNLSPRPRISDISYKILNVAYRIYSSELPGRSFNFEFSKGGAYSRKALFRGMRSLNISKDIKLLSTCLLNQTIRNVIITEG